MHLWTIHYGPYDMVYGPFGLWRAERNRNRKFWVVCVPWFLPNKNIFWNKSSVVAQTTSRNSFHPFILRVIHIRNHRQNRFHLFFVSLQMASFVVQRSSNNFGMPKIVLIHSEHPLQQFHQVPMYHPNHLHFHSFLSIWSNTLLSSILIWVLKTLIFIGTQNIYPFDLISKIAAIFFCFLRDFEFRLKFQLTFRFLDGAELGIFGIAISCFI